MDHLCNLLLEVTASAMNGGDDIKSSTAMLQALLEVLHHVLKYVSEVVRKALQVTIPYLKISLVDIEVYCTCWTVTFTTV